MINRILTLGLFLPNLQSIRLPVSESLKGELPRDNEVAE